jgi:hypothetical protein
MMWGYKPRFYPATFFAGVAPLLFADVGSVCLGPWFALFGEERKKTKWRLSGDFSLETKTI